MGDTFVHLHCHTEFSMLDGAARVHDLFKGAERMGMPALTITNHGNLYGAYEFYKASKNYDVKPIIGLEAYLTPRTHRTERKRVQFGDGTGDSLEYCKVSSSSQMLPKRLGESYAAQTNDSGPWRHRGASPG